MFSELKPIPTTFVKLKGKRKRKSRLLSSSLPLSHTRRWRTNPLPTQLLQKWHHHRLANPSCSIVTLPLTTTSPLDVGSVRGPESWAPHDVLAAVPRPKKPTLCGRGCSLYWYPTMASSEMLKGRQPLLWPGCVEEKIQRKKNKRRKNVRCGNAQSSSCASLSMANYIV